MRIVFFGATQLGLECCEALIESGQELAGIVSMPSEFSISYSPRPVHNVTFADFKGLAEREGLPYLEMASSDETGAADTIRSWAPDFGLAIGWFYVVSREVRDLFPLGVAGIHASLLPRYRGGAPLVWALIGGERETGVTLFYLDDGVDAGDVIAQRSFPIADRDDIATLLEKATTASVALLKDFVPAVAAGTAPRLRQDESEATTYPQRSPGDGQIDWTRSSEEIRNFIRAQTHPYPGAFTIVGDKRVTIWDADVTERDS